METAEIIHIITEPSRFRLLQLLLRHHYCVKALSKKMGVSEPAISQHMRVLKRCGIVEGIKIGYQTIYKTGQCGFSAAASPAKQYALAFMDCQFNVTQTSVLHGFLIGKRHLFKTNHQPITPSVLAIQTRT